MKGFRLKVAKLEELKISKKLETFLVDKFEYCLFYQFSLMK